MFLLLENKDKNLQLSHKTMISTGSSGQYLVIYVQLMIAEKELDTFNYTKTN